MMATKSTLIKKITTLGILLTLTASSFILNAATQSEPDPTIKEVFTGETVKVSRLPENIYLRDPNDPDDIIWDRIPTYRIAVNAAPPVHSSTLLRFNPAQNGQVYFQLARTADRFYVRMRWKDATDNSAKTVDAFSDSAAIQFALKGENTSYMMGTGPDMPVNIWFWTASDTEVQNLAAGGFGSTTHLPEQTVTGKATYKVDKNPQNNQRRLVMSREIKTKGKHQIALKKGVVPIAFALWQGEDEQRDGNKVVTLGWVLMDLAAK